jgi:hypothetical protein
MNQMTAKFALPELKEGEIYGGAFIQPDGSGHHTIILDGDNDDADWQTQMDWAKSIGGDLPDRVEHAMFYKHLPDRFKKDWYWSNTQRSAGSAWFQHFLYGLLYWYDTSLKCRAVAVRRVPFNTSAFTN